MVYIFCTSDFLNLEFFSPCDQLLTYIVIYNSSTRLNYMDVLFLDIEASSRPNWLPIQQLPLFFLPASLNRGCDASYSLFQSSLQLKYRAWNPNLVFLLGKKLKKKKEIDMLGETWLRVWFCEVWCLDLQKLSCDHEEWSLRTKLCQG